MLPIEVDFRVLRLEIQNGVQLATCPYSPPTKVGNEELSATFSTEMPARERAGDRAETLNVPR